jgi:hypothetical protein
MTLMLAAHCIATLDSDAMMPAAQNSPSRIVFDVEYNLSSNNYHPNDAGMSASRHDTDLSNYSLKGRTAIPSKAV